MNRRTLIFSWLAVFCCAVAVSSGDSPYETPDLAVANAFIDSGNLSLAKPLDSRYWQAPNGRYYNVHEFIPVAAGVPLALVARALPGANVVPIERRFNSLAMLVGVACFATTLLLVAGIGVSLGLPYRAAVSGLGFVTLASQYLLYVGVLPDVSIAALVVAGCVVAWKRAETSSRGGWVVVGVLAGLAASVKLVTATLIPILLLLALTPQSAEVGSRRRRASEMGLGLIPGAILILAWNYIRTGGWLTAPYPPDNVTLNLELLGTGLLGTFASPGKGLLWFSPILLLVPLIFDRRGVGGGNARLSLLVFGSLGMAILVLAATKEWSGGGGWGIRFYVPWLPVVFVFVLAEVWRRRGSRLHVALAGLLAMGLIINAAGLVTNFHYREQLCGLNPWTFPGANVCAVASLPDNLGRTIGLPIPDAVVPAASAVNVFASNRLALWWYALRAFGLPAGVSWSIPCVLLAVAAVCWRRAAGPRGVTA